MGLSAFKAYQTLLKQGYHPPQMGFKCRAGDINQFAYRLRLARAFRGLNLEGYSEKTIEGYNGFFQIFLTHSSLERFLEINDYQINQLGTILEPYDPQIIIVEFRATDPKDRFYKFLYERINKRLKKKLERIYYGDETNIAYLSASIRHIFAHGHLTAHASGINPTRVCSFCNDLSDFMIEFMDAQFSKKIHDFQIRLENESSA
jgi:hypothetical protein